MIANRLKKLWPQLQGKKQHLPHHLDKLRLWGIRGIHDLDWLSALASTPAPIPSRRSAMPAAAKAAQLLGKTRLIR